MSATAAHPTLSYRDALYQAMRGALASDPRAMILGQGVNDHKGIFGTTTGLGAEFGLERVIDTPLAEEGMTGVAIGAALNGLYPIVTHIRADFSLLAMNQMVNLAAKYRYTSGGRAELPMLIRVVVGRSWGQGAQHSQSPHATLAHFPGLTVVMPASSQSILDTYPELVARYRNPVVSVEHRLMYDLQFKLEPEAPEAPGRSASPAGAGDPFAPGGPLASRLVREGSDVTIVACSIMVLEAQRASAWLAERLGIQCEIIDLHCVSRPDWDLVRRSVRKTGKLLVADTSWLAYGLAGEACRQIVERDPGMLKAPVETLGMAPAPCPTAKTLEDLFYPTQGKLAAAAIRLALGERALEEAARQARLPDERSMADVYKRFRGPF